MQEPLTQPLASPRISAVYRDDGSILLNNDVALPPITGSIPGRLAHWAEATPNALYLSEGNRTLTYAETEARRRYLSVRLGSLPVSREAPLMILGENSIEHALIMLAATAIGIPVAVVSPAYVAANAAPWQKFAVVFAQIEPACVLADDPVAAETALTALGLSAMVRSIRNLSWLDRLDECDSDAVNAAEASVGLDTVAKLLFTSGSTGLPKAVINTQRMMVSNMQALTLVWPFLGERPPVMVDWLPWNHTFGGNCCFNIALWFGGHLHIDKGRPTPALIGHTVAALRRLQPTLYFNVPVGYELLLPILETDHDFAAQFLGGLNFIFSAAAPMPKSLRTRLEVVAHRAIGRMPDIVGGWGSTETAPFSTALTFPTEHAANLGIPIPGTTIKMVPADGRYELRVRGPNVTPGYWRDSDATETAFDEEGFYRIGDAAKFADPTNPAAGVVFDGRTAENFKLASGTFVNVGALRLAIISASEKLISDVVITGEGRQELGLLIFTNQAACREYLEAQGHTEVDTNIATHPALLDRLVVLLRAYNAETTGSSTRIGRFLIAEEPLSAVDNEITDKRYINQQRVLARRAGLVEQLYSTGVLL